MSLLLQAVESQIFRNELHHLFWIAPRTNRGILDPGWSCREHAFALGAVALLSSQKAVCCHGRASFVIGSEGNRPPSGLDVDHTWLFVEKLGSFDLSVKAEAIGSGVQETYLARGKFSPPGHISFTSTGSQAAYDVTHASATHLEGVTSAIYLRLGVDPVTDDLIASSRSWVASPLTDELIDRFPKRPDIYVRAVLHLVRLLLGEAETLTKIGQLAAWKRLADPAGNAVEGWIKLRNRLSQAQQ